jgi:hypothetical protein
MVGWMDLPPQEVSAEQHRHFPRGRHPGEREPVTDKIPNLGAGEDQVPGQSVVHRCRVDDPIRRSDIARGIEPDRCTNTVGTNLVLRRANIQAPIIQPLIVAVSLTNGAILAVRQQVNDPGSSFRQDEHIDWGSAVMPLDRESRPDAPGDEGLVDAKPEVLERVGVPPGQPGVVAVNDLVAFVPAHDASLPRRPPELVSDASEEFIVEEIAPKLTKVAEGRRRDGEVEHLVVDIEEPIQAIPEDQLRTASGHDRSFAEIKRGRNAPVPALEVPARVAVQVNLFGSRFLDLRLGHRRRGVDAAPLLDHVQQVPGGELGRDPEPGEDRVEEGFRSGEGGDHFVIVNPNHFLPLIDHDGDLLRLDQDSEQRR